MRQTIVVLILMVALAAYAMPPTHPLSFVEYRDIDTSSFIETTNATTANGDNTENPLDVTPLENGAWEALKCKGDALMSAMHASDEDAGKYWDPLLPFAESRWTDFGMG